MPITLEEMKKGMTDKVAQQVVDTFIRKSQLLELLPFDNAVSPSGGSTLTYAYRIEQLEKKVDKHNQVIDRVYKLEKQDAVHNEEIKVANHRIEDLERLQEKSTSKK